MNYPNFFEERKLRKKGYKYVVGLDEAGRGPLAGPVVAAAVMINPKFQAPNFKQIRNSKFKCSKHVWNLGNWDLDIVSNFVLRASNLELRDSKKLSPKAREKFYKILTTHPRIEWGIGRVSEKVIDKINIKNAAELAMEKALQNLKSKILPRTVPPKAGLVRGQNPKSKIFLIIDGNNIKNLKLKTYNLKLIVKGDEKVFSCAAASILAKVTRDRIMERYAQKYPQYGFDRHKGYPTRHHIEMLKKYNPCQIHRKSFRPVAKIQNVKIKMENDKSKCKKIECL